MPIATTPQAAVLYDREAPRNVYSKDNSFDQQLDNDDHSFDEDCIDPVTMYRFEENTRRLNRLKAEIMGSSIIPHTSAEQTNPLEQLNAD